MDEWDGDLGESNPYRETVMERRAAREAATGEILAHIQELRRTLPELPQIARVEVGQAMLDWLKATARPHELPGDNPWRPAGWTPPPPYGSLFDVPVVLNEGLDPGAWRAIDRDGNVMKEGTL